VCIFELESRTTLCTPPFIEDRISAHAWSTDWKPRKPSWRLPQTSSIQLPLLPYLYDKSKSTYRHSTCTNTFAFQLSPWDLVETRGRFTSHNFLSFTSLFMPHFSRFKPKNQISAFFWRPTLIEKQRFCLSNLVKLFFQTKFTSRSYSGSFLVAGKSIRGVATCTYGKGFSFRLISTRMHWVILLMATRNLARKPVEVRSLSNFSHYFLRFQVATTDFWTINSC